MRMLLAWSLCLLFGCAAAGSDHLATRVAVPESGWAAEPTKTAGFDVQMFRAEANPVDAAVAAPQDERAQSARQVIYSAALRVVVVSNSDAVRLIQGYAEQAGGYLQESDARSITVRVPADKFEAVLARVATLGEVVERVVKASDVTEQMLDLVIRLDNARRTRDRLLAHLAKSEKIEDTLKIEAELARVSGEIEQIEGRVRFLESQIAMSTIRVELNAPAHDAADSGDRLGLPFEWIERLGDGLVAGTVESMPRKPRFLSNGPRFDPPPEFIRYFSDSDLVEAMNAEGVRLKVQRHENYDKGALAFWTKLARKALVQSRSLAVANEQVLGEDRAALAGTREVAGVPCGYLLVLARNNDYVYSFEAWGPREAFDKQMDALVAAARSLRK